MSIVLAAPAAEEPRTCPIWCDRHDPDGDVCLGAIVTVDVTDVADWQPYMANALSVGLGSCPEDGLTVGLAINHVGPYEVTVAAARQFALAILAECERAEAPLIPGPRASRDAIAGNMPSTSSFTTGARVIHDASGATGTVVEITLGGALVRLDRAPEGLTPFSFFALSVAEQEGAEMDESDESTGHLPGYDDAEGDGEPLADWERELLALPLADENTAGAWFDDEPEDGAL